MGSREELHLPCPRARLPFPPRPAAASDPTGSPSSSPAVSLSWLQVWGLGFGVEGVGPIPLVLLLPAPQLHFPGVGFRVEGLWCRM